MGLGLLHRGAVLPFILLLSAMFKSSSVSIPVTAILQLFNFPIIEQLEIALAPAELWFILNYGGGIVGNVLETP